MFDVFSSIFQRELEYFLLTVKNLDHFGGDLAGVYSAVLKSEMSRKALSLKSRGVSKRRAVRHKQVRSRSLLHSIRTTTMNFALCAELVDRVL